MMNYIWAFLFLSSFIYSSITGNISAFETALMDSSNQAVEFVISLCGIMAVWSGLMEIAEKTGLIHKLSALLLPFTKLLFPNQKDGETLSFIIMSFMSNLFGAGNSSTVFALRTMEKLNTLNNRKPTASNDMCTFAVVNMAIAPIFPVMTVQIRSQMNSQDPYSTVIPSLIASAITVVVSILACKYYERKY